jgi:hypothetical protein
LTSSSPGPQSPRCRLRAQDPARRGAAPGDLPVGQANWFELAINLRTDRELKLSIAPAFRLRADFMIE